MKGGMGLYGMLAGAVASNQLMDLGVVMVPVRKNMKKFKMKTLQESVATIMGRVKPNEV